MIQPKQGDLLIAEPFLKDPHFVRSVVLLCKHCNLEGSLGFVLNKTFEYTLDELITDMSGFSIPVFVGGPVQKDTIHYLHQYPNLIPDSVPVTSNIFWGGNFESIKYLIKNNAIDFSKIRFFLGYSGWEAGQLQQEMNEKTWLTTKAKSEIIFKTNADEIWKTAIKQMGSKYEMMIHLPIDPQLN